MGAAVEVQAAIIAETAHVPPTIVQHQVSKQIVVALLLGRGEEVCITLQKVLIELC